MKSGNLNFLEPSGPLQVCNETVLPFPIIYSVCVFVALVNKYIAHVLYYIIIRSLSDCTIFFHSTP